MRTGELICLTMSHVQVATLLSLAFFCTYPTHRFVRATSAFNFDELFDLRTKRAVEKLCCILHYFHHISKNMPSGIMKFRRQHADPLDWSNLSVPLSPLHVEVKGTIEDSEGMLHVDFANKFIGGGVLSFGCVQEEIRFLICPELIVSMLFCQVMKANEAIVITNSIRFSDYVGYAHSFEWRPRTKIEKINRDCSEIHSELVAIDAFSFRNRSAQFQKKFVDRELLKYHLLEFQF
ncbi:unnamed protein product [Dracunculus medinensis]|uniref:poly(ADP-ribose) glycohydrolase n=1 Tax=Dracunculus medinensis TaxID=318479 RepID=A0A3P7T513_DRAME|nr:unnamed protein product [Dracunculus medinensis]